MREQYDENLLLDYLEGQLGDDQRAEVEQWLRDDPALSALLSQMAADREAVRSLPEPEPPAWLMEEVDQQLERSMLLDQTFAGDDDQQAMRRHAMGRWVGYGALAASLLLTGAIVYYSFPGFLPETLRLDGGNGSVASDRDTSEPTGLTESAPDAPGMAGRTETRSERNRQSAADVSDDEARAGEAEALTTEAQLEDAPAANNLSRRSIDSTERAAQSDGVVPDDQGAVAEGAASDPDTKETDSAITRQPPNDRAAEWAHGDRALTVPRTGQVQSEKSEVAPESDIAPESDVALEAEGMPKLGMADEPGDEVLSDSARHSGAAASGDVRQSAGKSDEPGASVDRADATDGAGRVVLRIRTSDPARTLQRLQAVATEVGQAGVRYKGRDVAERAGAGSPDRDSSPMRTMLHVPRAALPRVLLLMNSPADLRYQRAALDRISPAKTEQAAAVEARGQASGDRPVAGEVMLPVPWPSLVPDYGAILSSHLPGGADNAIEATDAGAPGAPGDAGNETIRLPVRIELELEFSKPLLPGTQPGSQPGSGSDETRGEDASDRQ